MEEELNRPTTDIDNKTKLIFDIDKLDQLIKNNVHNSDQLKAKKP